MFGLFKRKPTQDEIEDAIEGKGGIDEDEDAFVIDNSEEEKELFFEGMLSQYVNPLFGPKFWQEPRKFSVYTNGLVEKERLKGSKHRFSTVNRLSFTLDSNTTLKKIVPEDADMQQFVFVVSCTVFSSRNSIFAADITAAPRIVKYMFRAFSKASYYEWLYKIKHIMDNTWMADQAVAKFGKNLGFRIRAIPKLKASSLVESKEDEKNANELGEEETVEVDLEAVEQERKRRNKKRRRRRHANMKLLLPNQTDFSIALEQRHYDSREQGGEILNLFLSHLERNILVADKVIGAREWRQRMNVVEARNKAKAEAATASAKKRKGKNRSAPKSRQRPLVGNNEAKEGKEEEEEEDDEEEEDIETVEGDDGGGEGEGKEEPERPSIWRFLPSLPSLSLLGFVSKEEKEAAEQEEQRKKKEERQKERDERARRRHDEPSTAVFLVRLRRAVYKNTMVVRALTVPRGPYRNGLYYRVFTEDGRLVVEYDPMYVWMNLDSIGKEMTGEVRRDWGQSEAEGRRDQGYDGTSDFDSDLMSTDESDNNGSDSDGGGSGSDDGEGWSSDDDVGGEAFEQEQSDDEEAGGTDTLVATSRDGLPSVSLTSPGDLRLAVPVRRLCPPRRARTLWTALKARTRALTPSKVVAQRGIDLAPVAEVPLPSSPP